MEKQIAGFSDVELKAICYDHLANIEQSQAIIKSINNELASRAQKAQTKPKMETEEVKVEGEVVETPAVAVSEETPTETTEEVA